MAFSTIDFIKESNRIEGIVREPTVEEIAEYARFMALSEITMEDVTNFVKVYQPGAMLRDKVGLNVRVGSHVPIPGGPKVKRELGYIISAANMHKGSDKYAFEIHKNYEDLHPFSDCNGRSGRMLWAWQMQKKSLALGFLHMFYYQSLQYTR